MTAQDAPAPRLTAPLAISAAWLVAALFTVILPLWVSPAGYDLHRTPKLALFRAEGIIVGTLLLLSAIHRSDDARNRWTKRKILLLPLLILVWTAIVSGASDDFLVSRASLVTVASGVAIFLIAWDRGRHGGDKVAWVLIIPAIINALATFIEIRPVWDVNFALAVLGNVSESSLKSTTPIGFVGNRDDLGGLLLPVAILALAMSMMPAATRLTRIAAVTLIAGLLTTKTLTAIAAFVAAAVVMGFMRSRKAGLASILAILFLVPVAFYVHPGLSSRRQAIVKYVRAGRFEEVIVGRIAPNMAALAMIGDHPITGVGPGLFLKKFSHYRDEAARRYPSLARNSRWWTSELFGAAHDDHLQVAAEGGVIAYLLLLASFAAGVSYSFRSVPRESLSEKQQLARMAAAPLFAGLFVLALAQFPLQLAVTLQMFIVSAGLVAGWGDFESV